MVKEVQQFRETKRKYEEDIVKIKNAHNVDILQVSEDNLALETSNIIHLFQISDERASRSA